MKATYDEAFAREARRAPVAPGQRGRCRHCALQGVITGSEHEWPCLILEDWICEAHCAEVQVEDYEDTRRAMASQVGERRGPRVLLETCARCPYGERAGRRP